MENHPEKFGSERIQRLQQELKALFSELSGLPESGIDITTPFTELGFDSLFLTQISQALQKAFGVKVTFRALLDQLSSIGALALFVASNSRSVTTEKTAGPQTSSVPTEERNGSGSAEVSSPTEVASPAKMDLGVTLRDQPTEIRPSTPASEHHVLHQHIAILQQQLEVLKKLPSQAGSAGGITAPVLSPSAVRAGTPPNSVSSAKPSASKSETDLKRFGPFKGIELGPKGGLTPRQEAALAQLTERYNRKTPGSKAYAQRHRSYYCDPRAAGNFRLLWKEMVYPIVCARSKGSRIWDIDGNEYIDVTLGFGANYFGHAPDFVVSALEDQIRKGFEIGPQSPLAGETAEMLCRMTGLERATFCNTGSEAVMAAIRVARTVTARDKIVYFTGDYHGIFDEVLARAGNVAGQPGALPIAPGIPPLPHMIVLEYGSQASLDLIQARADEIAAVLVEPVQSRHPDLQPREFLQALRKLTEQKEIALIFDEVVTGFRASPGGAQRYFGVRADMATYGKVVGGGMPIGILAGSRRFMDALDGGMWSFGDASYPEVGVTFFAGTFVRHPLTMAAVHATLKHLEKCGPELQRSTTARTARLVQRLNDYCESAGVPIRLQTFSSVFFYDFHPDLKYASLLFYHLRDRGVHIWEGRVGQVCTAHTDEDLEKIFQAFKSSIEEMQAGGFLPVKGAATADQVSSSPQLADTAAASPGAINRVSLTEAQKEIWIAAQMGDDANCAYNESCSLKLAGQLDVRLFQQALNQMVQRHDALRCRFSPAGDYQEFPEIEGVQLPVRDLTGLSVQVQPQQLQAIIEEDMATPFDLVNGPLLRVQLLKLSEHEHRFVFTTHHAVCDGWSFGVIFHELAQIYSALVSGKELSLAPAMQFKDYVALTQSQADSPEVRESEDYWIKKYVGADIPVLDLPYDRPRPALKTYNGSLALLRCDRQIFNDLKKAGGQMRNTLFGTLFANFYVLIHRLSGQEDIVVGIPAAGQTMVGSSDLVGHCLNFLPTRATLNPQEAFADYASRMKSEILDAYDHQNYTYGTLIQKLKIERDPSRLPLLSVMFNIDKRGLDKLNFGGLTAEIITNPKQFVNFDLFVNLVQGDQDLDLECEYNTDLFDHETVMRWLGHFQTLMAGIAAGPKTALGALPLMTSSQRSQVVKDWNQTQRNYPVNQTIHQLFEAQVDRTPNAVAAVFDGKQLSYRELNSRANGFARMLQEQGAGPDKLVALYSERNLDLLVGVLAVLKSGAAYVPLDPAYPQERVAFYIEDSRATIVLTQKALVQRLPAQDRRIICLDDSQPDYPIANPVSAVTSQNLAYVIYTSGSTGKPKGVAIEHQNAVNFIHWGLETFPAAELAGVLASTSVCFDLSIFELFVTLCAGGTIVLAENALQLPLLPTGERNRVTLINTVPSAISELLQANAIPPSVQVVNLAGELLTTHLVDQLYSLGTIRKVNDLYGPTETTTYSTWTLRTAKAPATIGRPLANTTVYVVDRELQPTPIGVAGELLIGGLGVARGYLHRPDLTSERFIADPFQPGHPHRVYRTGDLARYRVDGTLELLGRMDHQVKVRGFRIELGEIESLLSSVPTVRESVVVVRDDGDGQKRIVGYVSLRPADTGKSNGSTDELGDQWLQQWEETFTSAVKEAQKRSASIQDLDSIITSWTGLEDSAAHAREWIETSMERIQGLKPRRVLEMGCGTGQILLRLAPSTDAYWGADFSKSAVDALENEVTSRGLKNVRLLARAADDFQGIPEGQFDLFLLNSVSQYLPDADYLLRVIEGGVKCLAPGGRLFIGDIQSHSLLDCFHATSLIKNVSSSMKVEELRALVQQHVQQETELVIDPEFFLALPHRLSAITAVDVQLRRGRLQNETTQYHYDVVLHVGTSSHTLTVDRWQDWGNDQYTLSSLRDQLKREPSRTLGIRNIPDQRLAAHASTWASLQAAAPQSTVQECLESAGQPPSAVDPESLWELASELGMQVDIRWSSTGGPALLDAVFSPRHVRQGACAVSFGIIPNKETPLSSFANNPGRNHRNGLVAHSLKSLAASKLPEHMVPSTIVVLEALPRTLNGKVNRKALPAPLAAIRIQQRSFVAPRNDKEKQLATIWEDVLGLDRVSVTDSFFELGGDSLLSFRVCNRARQVGLSLTPRMFFQHKSIAQLIGAESAAGGEPPPAKTSTISRISRDAHRRRL